MLVLSRKVGQKVKVGKNIYIEVLGVPGTRVKLAFEAPPEVKILRGELEDMEPPHEEPLPVPVAA